MKKSGKTNVLERQGGGGGVNGGALLMILVKEIENGFT